MRKTIPLDKLTIGMHIVGIDKSWLETPFLVHSMTIKNAHQIEQLRAAGVRMVEIDLTEEEGSSSPPAGVPSPEELTQFVLEGGQPTQVGEAAMPDTPFEEELPLARRAYRDATAIVRAAMQDVRMGKTIRAEPVGEIVTRLTESVLRNRDALLSLSRLKSLDEYTFYHSVNTAVLALGLAQKLEVERDALFHLGTGALLHDIGKMKIPSRILNKPARLAADEFEIMKQHALHGVEILQSTTALPNDAIKPALEHHERVDGTGYPFQRTRQEISRFGMIASVVDIYDAVTSDRVYHTAMPPHRALQLIFKLAQEGHLDRALVEHFIQCVGLFPVGSCVALDGGEIGIVQKVHRDQPLAPVVLLVLDAGRRRIRTPQILNLAAGHEPIRRITDVIDPRKHRIDTNAYLDAVAA